MATEKKTRTQLLAFGLPIALLILTSLVIVVLVERVLPSSANLSRQTSAEREASARSSRRAASASSVEAQGGTGRSPGANNVAGTEEGAEEAGPAASRASRRANSRSPTPSEEAAWQSEQTVLTGTPEERRQASEARIQRALLATERIRTANYGFLGGNRPLGAGGVGAEEAPSE